MTVPPLAKTPGALQAFDVLMRVVFTLLTLLVGTVAYQGQSLMGSVNDHEKRITVIESNRYTSSDAVRDAREISQSISALRGWIETQYPPQWLKEDVAELKADVRDLTTAVNMHVAREHVESSLSTPDM